MIRILPLVVLAAAAAAEVVEYRGTEPIVVPMPVSTSATSVDAIRSVTLLGVTKATVKGTWSTDALNVVQNGNILRFALLQNPPGGRIPVTAVGDNGVLYHIEVRAAEAGAKLDPIVNVVSVPGAGNAGAQGRRPRCPAGCGSAAGERRLLRARHQPGAPPAQAHPRRPRHPRRARGHALQPGHPRPAARRVPGKVWTLSDDWRVLGYYEWTLGQVTATYVGITYTGRESERDFAYLAHQTVACATSGTSAAPSRGRPMIGSTRRSASLRVSRSSSSSTRSAEWLRIPTTRSASIRFRIRALTSSAMRPPIATAPPRARITCRSPAMCALTFRLMRRCGARRRRRRRA